MDSGTYNNVRRGTNPLSPMSPATPGATPYKANVNRTKTRKWVEAKVQNYDGDDWGNEYDDDDDDDDQDEPEQTPPRTTGRGQLGQLGLGSRTFPQPAAASSGLRDHNGPPSLRVQTQPTSSATNTRFGPDQAQKPPGAFPGRPEYHPAASLTSQSRPSPASQGSGLLASRFPPRQSSMTQQGPPDLSSAVVSRVGTLPVSLSDARAGQPADVSGKPSSFARSADIFRRMSEDKEGRVSIGSGGRPSFSNHAGRGEETGPKDSHKLPLAEPRQIPPTLASDPDKKQGLADDRRLSVSPQLPDVVRMSGFGDDFLSMSAKYNAQNTPALTSISDNQHLETGSTGAARAEEKRPSSTIEGPKLQPNPDIIMPPANGMARKPAAAPQQPAVRPQLPGSWVSENTNAGTEQQLTSPVQSTGGAGATTSSTTEANGFPAKTNGPEPADIEPTTQVKHLPSSDQSLTTMAKIKSDFDGPTGRHDDAVASEVISAGPGHHPTPQSLPPLKTDNPLAPPTSSNTTRPTAPAPTHYSPATQPTTSTPSEFAPTAPLNPRRASVNPLGDVALSPANDRTATLSTAGTGSPQKESDKLREEIIKSLGPAASDADVALIQSQNGKEPAPGELSRESTYLSDVYDDYLLAAEEKSLQETGEELKKGYMMSANQSIGASNTGHPPVTDVAPLSPQRGPKPKSPDRPRRFSWEQGLEPAKLSPIDTRSPIPAILPASHATGLLSPQTDGVQSPSDGLHALPTGDGTHSQRVSQVSSRGPDDIGSVALDPPSPLSFVVNRSPKVASAGARTSQLSLAEEKEQELIDHSASSPEQHPALARDSESPEPPLSGTAHDTTAQTSLQPKIPTFREILNIASTEHRIRTFEETREQFSAMETGLSNWIVYMQSQVEHGGTGMPAGDSSGGLLSPSQQSPTGTSQPAQQPYYQQYLNASNPNGSASQPGRTPSGNLHMLSGQPASGFGSSGNQVGVKSKELLHAAGMFGNKGVKSGMKLFNKGRNKLRERAGEKQNY